MNKVAVLGAGNGGLSMGAYLSLRGCSVHVFDKFPAAIEDIQAAGGVTLKGVSLTGFAKFDVITTSIPEVMDGCDVILVVTPAFAHRELATKMAPYLTKGQKVILNPGRTAGALEFYLTAKDVNPEADFIVAETQSLIYACRKTGAAEVTIYKVKKEMELAALPAYKTKEILAEMLPYYPQFIAAENVLETSFLNIGAIFHPTPALLNIARIEGKDLFEYYMDGITPCVSNVLERIDAERVAVASALGIETMTCIEWLEDVYEIPHMDGTSIYEAVQKQEGYRGIEAPKNPFARYISEDVPMSLVPLAEFGRIVGVPTPTMNLMIDLANLVHKTDYRERGRTLARLKLEGVSVEDLKKFVTDGTPFPKDVEKGREIA
ncbi:MAG: NAD/NADP octopine/nopaline dehydrogenase family protein [Aminobacterium sp.]|uniref:NAD/NADP-dependent octopine/nopaline dehydrogenase family protein n=1 Tax=Aminobacterium sp. MB27-C1 TaxID=3070661 RepID=UPI001BCD6EB3|nr:NAD/NADP-dependent octopine/nopaline dehydrogenase family protein [Aminobacterium sp. MB27-C1]MDD2206681.1 NAD/NADP octopine/nopaline dehydrogenase family protein [Aminobacterium sp.]MDD3425324.1 NAD/NADP octopine/nopaline dehydrogenase family protein [Aminobacterium sp.]MDD3706901.1 NAD/NADP octopine/nopaline dehydrogenase family protein [Aminobacterium sp.]MDD4228843.1 NAD/NADP octopine/nopaline dehydrogenase family protein [Aminobacterium sp.]MDD4551040.1 NAD/NADP octopine/nopaline dehyd